MYEHEIDRQHELLRDAMMTERRVAEDKLRTKITVALIPVKDEAMTREALKQWKHWLEQKHLYHRLGFVVKSDEILAWLSNRQLLELIHGQVEHETKVSSTHGTWVSFTRRHWSWKKLRYVRELTVNVKFDYEWWNSAPR